MMKLNNKISGLIFIILLAASAPVFSGGKDTENDVFCRAMEYSKHGDLKNAEREFNKASRPNQKEARFNLGICYYQSKDYDRALREFKRVQKLDNKYSLAYYYEGLASEIKFIEKNRKGMRKNALAAWENYLKYADKSDVQRIKYAREHLDALKAGTPK